MIESNKSKKMLHLYQRLIIIDLCIVICLILVVFNAPMISLIDTFSLHDALPIYLGLPRALQEDAQAAPSAAREGRLPKAQDRKSTRLNSSHVAISYAVFCLKKKKQKKEQKEIQMSIEAKAKRFIKHTDKWRIRWK